MTTQDHPSDDLVPVPIRVRKDVKARWIRRSREEGKRLGDWIVERVEREEPAPPADPAGGNDDR